MKKNRRKNKKNPWFVIIVFAAAFFAVIINRYVMKPTAAPDSTVRVHFIDVGQGDSEFIQTDGKNMLIDCGESDEYEKVSEYLHALSVDKLDFLVMTHPHADHMGAMPEVINEFSPDQIIIPKVPADRLPTTRVYEKFLDAALESSADVSYAEAGQRVVLSDDASVAVIAPLSAEYKDLNNYSVVLRLVHGEDRFLFTGDAEKESEREMSAGGKPLSAQVLKAGHHGSSSSCTPQFLKAVGGSYAVISCGDGNSYGHPAPQTLANLTDCGYEILRTDLLGDIVFDSNGDGLPVLVSQEGQHADS